MEKRGRKKANYSDLLTGLIKSEYQEQFFNQGKAILPPRSEKIYDTLVSRLKEKKYNVNRCTVFLSVKRYLNDWFENNHEHEIDDKCER